MLSKQTGASQFIVTSATTQTVTLTTNTDGSTIRKVRIATQDHAVLIAFNTTTNLTTAGIMIPPNSAEHFTLEGSTVVSIVRYGSQDAPASITPVA